jgi:hypothetical protein
MRKLIKTKKGEGEGAKSSLDAINLFEDEEVESVLIFFACKYKISHLGKAVNF